MSDQAAASSTAWSLLARSLGRLATRACVLASRRAVCRSPPSLLAKPRASKPSSWLTISSIVRCTSLSPPAPAHSSGCEETLFTALHLVVAPRAVVEPRATNRVDLVEKDDARLLVGAAVKRRCSQLMHAYS